MLFIIVSSQGLELNSGCLPCRCLWQGGDGGGGGQGGQASGQVQGPEDHAGVLQETRPGTARSVSPPGRFRVMTMMLLCQ